MLKCRVFDSHGCAPYSEASCEHTVVNCVSTIVEAGNGLDGGVVELFSTSHCVLLMVIQDQTSNMSKETSWKLIMYHDNVSCRLTFRLSASTVLESSADKLQMPFQRKPSTKVIFRMLFSSTVLPSICSLSKSRYSMQALGSSPSPDAATESLDLLIVSLQSFPSPFRHHSEAVETAVINLLLRTPLNTMSDTALSHSSLAPSETARAATALALLPVAAGDAATWSALIRRLLIALNTLLVPTLSGLESPAAFEAAASLLLAQGSPPPAPLGRFDWSLSNMPTGHLWPPTVAMLTSLLTATQALLTSPYPVPIPVPVAPVLALVARLLHVHGSLSSSVGAYDALAGDRQAAVLAELPNVQILTLDLAGALLAGAGTHLLPHGEQVAGFVGDTLRRTAGEGTGVSELRLRAYRAAEETLACMGAGKLYTRFSVLSEWVLPSESAFSWETVFQIS